MRRRPSPPGIPMVSILPSARKWRRDAFQTCQFSKRVDSYRIGPLQTVGATAPWHRLRSQSGSLAIFVIRDRDGSTCCSSVLGLYKVTGIEAFGEPTADAGEEIPGLLLLAAFSPQPREGKRGAEFEEPGLLIAGDRDRLLKACLAGPNHLDWSGATTRPEGGATRPRRSFPSVAGPCRVPGRER